MSVATRLRELLAQPDLFVAPGAYDALSARLIADATIIFRGNSHAWFQTRHLSCQLAVRGYVCPAQPVRGAQTGADANCIC